MVLKIVAGFHSLHGSFFGKVLANTSRNFSNTLGFFLDLEPNERETKKKKKKRKKKKQRKKKEKAKMKKSTVTVGSLHHTNPSM